MGIKNETSPAEGNMAIYKMFSWLINYDLAASFIEIDLETILAKGSAIIYWGTVYSEDWRTKSYQWVQWVFLPMRAEPESEQLDR